MLVVSAKKRTTMLRMYRLAARGHVLVCLDPLQQGSAAVTNAATQLMIRGAVAGQTGLGQPALAHFQEGRRLVGRQHLVGMCGLLRRGHRFVRWLENVGQTMTEVFPQN